MQRGQCHLLSSMIDFEGKNKWSLSGLSLPTAQVVWPCKRGEDWCCSGSPCHLKCHPWQVVAYVEWTVGCQSSILEVSALAPLTFWARQPATGVSGSLSCATLASTYWIPKHILPSVMKPKMCLIPPTESHCSTDKFQGLTNRISKHSKEHSANFRLHQLHNLFKR